MGSVAVGIIASTLAVTLAACGGGKHRATDPNRDSSVVSSGAISIAIGQPSVSRTIRPGFLGLSIEYRSLTALAGSDPKAINPVFVQLVRNLTPGQSPVLRIGGDSTDWTWWPVPGMVRPPGIKSTLTRRWLTVLLAVSQQLGARLIPGINLEADSPAVAAAEAQAFISTIGAPYIDAFEVGNEPDLYSSFGWYRAANGQRVTGRPPSYDFPAFLSDFARISAALPPSIPRAGPSAASPGWDAQSDSFLAAQPAVRVLTLHRYPLSFCGTPPTSPIYPRTQNLLLPSASERLPAGVAPRVASAHARGVAVRVDEFNTVSCGPAPAVTHSFAAALWTLDELFAMANVGVDGVNIHTYTGRDYHPFGFAYRRGGWSARVAPQYYGMLMFARAAPPGAHLVSTRVSGAPPTLRVWCTKAPDGSVRLTLINEGTTGLTVALNAPNATTAATIDRLQGPSLSAQTGVTIDGQSFGTSTTIGVLKPSPQPTSTRPVRGHYVIGLQAASATLLTFR